MLQRVVYVISWVVCCYIVSRAHASNEYRRRRAKYGYFTKPNKLKRHRACYPPHPSGHNSRPRVHRVGAFPVGGRTGAGYIVTSIEHGDSLKNIEHGDSLKNIEHGDLQKTYAVYSIGHGDSLKTAGIIWGCMAGLRKDKRV